MEMDEIMILKRKRNREEENCKEKKVYLP